MGVRAVWRQSQPVRRAAKTLSRILDDILDRPGERSEMSTSDDVSGTVSGHISPMATDMDSGMLTEYDVDSETFLDWFDNLEWETIH